MATVYRLLDVGRQFFDNNGAVLAGGKLTTYEAGTTTAKATYKTSAGTTAHANPIILDSAGRIPTTEEVWGTTGAYKLKLDTTLDVNVWTKDDIAGIGDTATTTGTEWVTFSGTPTRTGNTTFTLSGDQTTAFHLGRRLKIVDSTTLYATITASTYGAPNTTITVVVDGGTALSASMNAASSTAYGLISNANTSSPAGLVRLGSGSISGAPSQLDFTGLTSAYRSYLITISNFVLTTDAQTIISRLSVASVFQAGATDYAHISMGQNEAGTDQINNSGGTTGMALHYALASGNLVTEEMAGNIWIIDPGNTGSHTQILFQIVFQNASAQYFHAIGGGQYQTVGATDGFRLLPSGGGTIASGDYTIYGVRA